MGHSAPPPNLIATTLEEDVKQHLRKYGLVIWLDKDAHYVSFVDRLVERYQQGDFFAPVVPFRGSFLEMLLALEPYGNGEDADRLLIHMPGHVEETIRKTPILELYRAGYRYRRALDTLIREAVTGKVNPDRIEAFLSPAKSARSESNTADATLLTLERAETWLAECLSQPTDDLSQYLNSLSIKWVLEILINEHNPANAPTTDSTADSTADNTTDSITPSSREPGVVRLSTPQGIAALQDYFHRHTGLDANFLSFYLEQPLQDLPICLSLSNFSEGAIAWLLCVEYVRDLNRDPYLPALQPLRHLSKPLQKTCESLIDTLRSHPDIYASLASSVGTRLDPELSRMQPEDLGSIDTFPQEEIKVLEAALIALLERNWQKAYAWASDRLKANSFWMNRDRDRRLEWVVIQDAAHLGLTLQQHQTPLRDCVTLRDALEIYTGQSYQVDLAHRHFEQRITTQLNTKLPHFVGLLEVAEKLRQDYRQWVDELAQAFAQCCEAEGFLSEPDLQQRYLYEQVVHPLTQVKAKARASDRPKVAYFLIDAFRYEMAVELQAAMQDTAGASIQLQARYAELPTLTEVGMNALAPVAKSGILTLGDRKGFSGFKTGEYTVRKPEDRVRAMGDRSLTHSSTKGRNIKSVTLEEIWDLAESDLKKRCGDADLIAVHHRQIDKAGEATVGSMTFDRLLQRIRSTWSRLKNMGVNEFVFTADHGFLLQDVNTRIEPYGKKQDCSRRYVLTDLDRRESGTVVVSFKALNYEGQSGYLLFRRDTAMFDTGKTKPNFVHGGNSLQERVIPVLTVSHRYYNDLRLVEYKVEVEPKPSFKEFSRLQLRVKPVPTAQGVLSFTGQKYISLALQVCDRPDIDVIIQDAPGARIDNQQIQVELDKDWTEVFFTLQGQKDERVQVQVYHPEGNEKVIPAQPDTYFQVSGSQRQVDSVQKDEDTSDLRPDATPTETAKPSTTWQDKVEDEGVRQVFAHIEQYGSVTEVQLIQILGTARKVRRFATAWEDYIPKLPFSIRIETTATGKRYVKA